MATATEFDRKVGHALNLAIPSFERSLGRPATASERLAIVTATRRELGESSSTPAAGGTPPNLVMPKDSVLLAKYAVVMESALKVAANVAKRGLSVAEVEDLSASITARLEAEAKPLNKAPITDFRASLAEAVISGKLGAASSPGLQRVALSAEAEAAKVRAPGLTDKSPRQLAAMDSETYHRAMEALALTTPFGAQRLDGK
jgi:hypothetical protein